MNNRLTKALAAGTAIACTLATAAHAAITISTHKTKDESCAAGICTPTGPNPNIRVKDLEKLLAKSDIKIVTGQGSTGIGVLDPLTWASNHRLTLDANQTIHVRAPIVVEGTGGITLITNDGGTGGDYFFDAPGSLTFWDTTGSLVVNGQNYTLVKDVATLASAIAQHPSRNYALSGDYDASADGVYDVTPIATTFTGTLEGLGHAVSKLSIDLRKGEINGGLFAHVAKQGTVRDLGLANISVAANNGGLAGSLAALNDGVLIRDYATGSVSTIGTAGGLVGQDSGKIIGSYSSAGVSSADDCAVGGLVGEVLSGGIIESSHATGGAGGHLRCNAGGLAGINGGKIQNSYATGQANGGGTSDRVAYAGGLVGVNTGLIASSFATGSAIVSCCVSEFSEGWAGGLVAENGGGSIRDSYATGNAISGEESVVGGLVGQNDGRVSTSYSTGHPSNGEPAYAGGLAGIDGGDMAKKTYWNLDTSGITDLGQGAGTPRNDPGITGLTDAQLKSALPAGFDPNVWGQNASINNGWPYLLANPPQ